MDINILKKEYALYIFLVIGSGIGWIAANVNSHLLNKLSPITLIILDTLFVFLIVLFGSSILLKGNLKNVKKEISTLVPMDYFKIFFVAFVLLTVELLGVYLLKNHGIYKTTLSTYIIDIGVSAIGFYLLMGEKLTLKHIVGFIMMAIGGFLFSR